MLGLPLYYLDFRISKIMNKVNELSNEQKQQLCELYQLEWWTTGRTLKDVDIILNNSSFIVAYVNNNKLVAFARVLTDYFSHAYIYDVIVEQDFRKSGLGKILINAILNHEKLANIKSIELICRKELMPFYEQFGFTADYGLSTTMRIIKN